MYISIYKACEVYKQSYKTVTNTDFIYGSMFFPERTIKEYPDYIPAPIREDYREACLIVSLSPKASATISRRCLQGILRDFWKVKPDNLNKEIEQIKDKVDDLTYEAIDAVRKIGNIGAHMEKDINYIIDVDEKEAELLINLLDLLLENWYIENHKREERLKAIKEIADNKDKQRQKKEM